MGKKIIRVPIRPQVLRWAQDRSGLDTESLQASFPQIKAWEKGKLQPTIKQLEKFAQITHIPFGFLFLDMLPEIALPIQDFRIRTEISTQPSLDLLDTIYICQQRQDWYRNFQMSLGEKPISFVGSSSLGDDPLIVAANIRDKLEFDIEERRRISTWAEALKRFIERTESSGILVMSSGIVGSNTRRKLNTEEFGGFALVDDLAPVVFINSADTKSAQMFTLAHELAHIWLGKSGVSDADINTFPDEGVERWCNQVAAELLVPLALFRKSFQSGVDLFEEMNRLAHIFKVSTLVILRRIYEIGAINREEFQQAYQKQLVYLRKLERRSEGGGNFYHTLNSRVSKTFAQSVVISALEGQTLFRDAFQLLNIRKQETFNKFARMLEVK